MARRKNLPQPIEPLDPAGLGPAMLTLTPLMRCFVIAKVHGGLNNADAAQAAGYHGDRKVLATTGYKVAHREDVQAAILEEGRKLMRSEGARSILTLVKIRDDDEAEHKDRIKAATELLNRAGFHAITESHQVVEHRLSEAEADRRILALCAELGLSPDEAQKMLVSPADFAKNAEGVYEMLPEPPPSPSENALRIRRHRESYRGLTADEIAAKRAQMRAKQAERSRQEYAAAQAVAPETDGED